MSEVDVMADEKHLYVTAQGNYISQLAALANESWQVGVRFALVFGSIDDIGTLPNNWSPVPTTIARTETDWTIDGNWTISGPGGSTFHPDDWLNDQLAPAFDAWLGSSVFSSTVQLQRLRVYPIGTTGKAIPAPPFGQGSPVTLQWTSNPLPKGGASGEVVPPQISVVASHRTGQVGRTGRGRMFTPIGPNSNTSLGVLSSTAQDNLAGTQKALLESCAVSLTVPTVVNVRPCVVGKPWTNYAVITSVRVGNVYDTQRRRRRSATETFVSQSLAY